MGIQGEDDVLPRRARRSPRGFDNDSDETPDIRLPTYQGSDSDPNDLSTGDWIACILCSGIACIMGIVRLTNGKPNGGKMIAVSLVFVVIWNVLYFIITSAGRR